jgi:hypothetical protein
MCVFFFISVLVESADKKENEKVVKVKPKGKKSDG